MNNDTPLIKRAYNLGLKAVSNFVGLSEKQIKYYEQHLDEIPKALLRGFIIPTEASDLLDFVGTVQIMGTTGKFVAKEKFMVNTKRNAPVKISYLGDNFTKWFLNGDGKTEDPISEQTLRCAKLRKTSFDVSIIDELGGKEKSETTLSEMFSLMEKQKNGEDGVLLNNGYANIFYIKDDAGVLRTVHVYWHDGGWHVYAYSVEDPHWWRVGDVVFSRNSVLKSSETSALAQA